MRDNIFEEFYKSMNRMNNMFEEMDKLFYEDRLGMPSLLSGPSEKKVLAEGKRRPVTEFEEKDKNLIARFELPGVDKKDIDINISESKIEIEAKHREEKEEKKAYSLSRMAFYKSISLPEKIDTSKVKASFKNGVLEITMPKQKQVESKKLLIE